MAVQATSIGDALIASLNNLGKMKLTDLMSDYQNTIALKRIFKKNKTTFEDGSGPEFQFNIIKDHNHSARHVGLAYVGQYGIPNLLETGKMPWRHTHWNWSMERRLMNMNKGGAKIIDIAQTQRMAALGSAIILFEETLWRCPTAAEFNADTPVGIPYFVVKSATAATAANNDGFNGLAGSDHTLVANINPTTGASGRYRNYADAYVAITEDDLIDKMRRANWYTDFMPLVDGMPTYETGNDYGIYTNYPVVSMLEKILRSRNENLGPDIAAMDGKAVFHRTPVTPVKQLNADTTNPLYGLNWGCLGAKALNGEWMNEQHFPAEASQPTITTTVTDCSWNLFCTNRRKQWVISNGTTMPS